MPLSPHTTLTDKRKDRRTPTAKLTPAGSSWWRGDGGAPGSNLVQKNKREPYLHWECLRFLLLLSFYPDADERKNIHKSLTVFSSSDLQMAQDNKWCQWNPRLGPWFLIWMGQKCAAVMINKWLVVAAWRPDCTFTLSLWGRPNDFYLPLRKHIKAISDCGGSSVLDHAAAAVLAEAWLVSVGSSFCSLCKQKEALRKSSWLIPFASIPLLKAVRRLPGKPNMMAKPKHDSASWRTRHSWGIEHGNAF